MLKCAVRNSYLTEGEATTQAQLLNGPGGRAKLCKPPTGCGFYHVPGDLRATRRADGTPNTDRKDSDG